MVRWAAYVVSGENFVHILQIAFPHPEHFPNLKQSLFFGGERGFIQTLFSSFEFCTDGFVVAKIEIGIIFILEKNFSGKSFQDAFDF